MKTTEKIAELTGVDRDTIKSLISCGLIEPRNVTRFLACEEFKEKKRKNPDVSNTEIYFQISENHNVSESTVYKWVNNY